MNIDDIADRKTGERSPGEKFREQWLSSLPKTQWPNYIDDTAPLIKNGGALGDTDLTTADFPRETGWLYRRGLASTAGVDLDETTLPIADADGRRVGLVSWVFNELADEIARSSTTALDDPGKAIEAAINKSLYGAVDDADVDPGDVDRVSLPRNATVSDLMTELYCRPRSEEYLDALYDIAASARSGGYSLLERLEEPWLLTELWDHQREALSAWFDADCRGTVNMATATGKTIVGLAAIAHHFGRLAPADRDLEDPDARPDPTGKASVVVVADTTIVLEQWQREFERHLNIPRESLDGSGELTATFDWGTVKFWTPRRLRNADVASPDLVILDEAHHYVGDSGFGSVFEELDNHVLAMSGSLSASNERTLARRDIETVYEFTLVDGQAAGIIPECDLNVWYVPYENQSRLADVTRTCREGLDRYGDGFDDVDAPAADAVGDVELDSVSDARSFAQRTEGRELKEQSADFREFASATRARQTTMFNLSPALDDVIDLVLDHVRDRKVVVLLDSGDEIDAVTRSLERELDDYDDLVTVVSAGRSDDPLAEVEAFDREQSAGALVGTGKTIGEGVDIRTADVAINRGRGSLNRSLVQRMGRILRNPDGEKRAVFHHVTAVPTEDEALLPEEDGISLLETASKLRAWGDQFDAPPAFHPSERYDRVEGVLEHVENRGAAAVRDRAGYDWPDDGDVEAELRDLCDAIREATAGPVLVEATRDDPVPERTGPPDGGGPSADGDPPDEAPSLPAVSPDAAADLVAAAAETDAYGADSADGVVNAAVRNYLMRRMDEVTDA